ncbi:hypothetical protein NFI96_024400 [Prochilodus magdalenae]|nr:hypothetical protein NFI96_024400 [Prochilodus magdalenae]
MSSPAEPHLPQSLFLSRWIPSSSRAGVFLSESPGEVSSLRSSCNSVVQEDMLDDSFCSQFAPLPVSRSSSLDSVMPKVSETDTGTETSSSQHDTVHDILKKAQGLPLIAKLEQLKQLQQRMQEQLKAHQQGQLQKLQTEQQKFLGIVHPGTGLNQEKQTCQKNTNALEPLQAASTLSNAQHSFPWAGITHQQEAARALVSSMWDHHPSVELSRFGHSGDEDTSREDPSLEEESLQSIIEDESVHSQVSSSEPQDRPIKSANSGKTFEEMLEEQLKLENEKLNKNIPAETVKVKRPFLRRGEGLSRFTRGPSKERTPHSSTKPTSCLDPPTSQGQAIRSNHQSSAPKRPSPKSTTTSNVVIQRKTAVLNKENNPQSKAVVPATKTVKPHVLGAHQGQNTNTGALKHLSKTGRIPDPHQKITSDAIADVSKEKSSQHVQDAVDPRGHSAENSFEVWLAERGKCWDKEHQRECVELGEFELLERAADELSFSSNSSFICTLLRRDGRRLSSTPVKSHQQPMLPGPVQQSATNIQKSLPDLPVDSVAMGMKQNPVINECSEDEDKIQEEDSDVSLCSSTEFHQTAFGPSQPFSHCFQVSQAPPYNKHSYQDRVEAASLEEEENNGDSTLVETKSHVDFDDDDTWNEPEDLTCVSTEVDNQAGRALTRKVAVAKTAEPDVSSDSLLDHEPDFPPTCQLVAKLFPALKPKPNPPPPVAQDVHSEQATAQSRLLRERLVELETEIERFKTENAVLSRIRKENEDVKENLRKEKAEFQQKMADELAKWEEFKREENRKLQRDKKLFEKHAATVRARPDKQERDEIQSLKQQLNTLQEDLRKREARWTSTQHRLRQQVDSLNAENTTLRDQVRMMEKLRLTAWRNAECEREREKDRGRSTVSSSSSSTTTTKAAQKRTQSKSPSCSRKSSSTTANRKETPELQNPRKAAVKALSARSAACNSKIQSEEPNPVADPLATSGGQTVPDRRSDDSLSNTESSSEFDCSAVFTEQAEMEQEEIMHLDGKIEKVLPDGGRLIVFPNGTRKEMSADGLSVKVTFFNGDTKHVMPDQRVIYYYAGAQTTHTTYPDGMEVLQFPNNQIEKHFPDGRKEITFPDQTVKNLYPDGREESVLADGTIIQQNPDGSKEIQFNTGQRELHTADFKRREYPDGTVKTVYSDGRQETRYPNGRVRLKDPQGRVVMDSTT